mmetsp:Transcript_80807/g.250907  ORF Transcript_80807/g.250907 Transcript_80807/m.250907 type:complete len:252 (-) Transcript_80807:8-763(-)
MEAVAFRHADDVHHLILAEYVSDLDLLLEQSCDEVNLLLNGAAVDLDLLNVGLLRANLHFGDLGVADCSDDLAVLLGPGDLSSHRSFGSLGGLAPTLLILGECLLLARMPGLVKPALALLVEVASPHGGERPHAAGCLHIPHEADDNHGWRLQDSDWLDNLLFVELGAWLVDVTDDVGHAGLVGHEGREVRRLGRVILGEAFDLPEVVFCTLPRQETQRTVTRSFKLPVRHACPFSCRDFPAKRAQRGRNT